MKDLLFYKLEGKIPVPLNDVLEWSSWFETAERHVAVNKIDGVTISTVFLGVDHGYPGKPQLFETMIWGGPRHGETIRYATWEEAEAGHAEAMRIVAKGGQ